MKKFDQFLNESLPSPGHYTNSKPSWEDNVTYNVEADVHFYGLDESKINFKLVFSPSDEITDASVQERAIERLSKEFDNIIEDPLTKEKRIKVSNFVVAPENEQIRPMY